MEALFSPDNWGSPVGLGLFFFLMSVGGGVLFWGISLLNESTRKESDEKDE